MNEKYPALLSGGAVAQYLGIRPYMMGNLGPQLHRLEWSGNARRFPLIYVQYVRNSMGPSSSGVPSIAAEKFSNSRLAASAIAAAELDLQNAITSKFTDLGPIGLERGIEISELEQVLCLNTAESLYYLRANHSLELHEKGAAQYVGESSLREVISWGRPQNYKGEHIAPVIQQVLPSSYP